MYCFCFVTLSSNLGATMSVPPTESRVTLIAPL